MRSRLWVCVRTLVIVASIGAIRAGAVRAGDRRHHRRRHRLVGRRAAGRDHRHCQPVETGQVRTAVTGTDGFYTIPLVNPGVYQVKATLSGFRTTIRDNITVVVNESVRADRGDAGRDSSRSR